MTPKTNEMLERINPNGRKIKSFTNGVKLNVSVKKYIEKPSDNFPEFKEAVVSLATNIKNNINEKREIDEILKKTRIGTMAEFLFVDAFKNVERPDNEGLVYDVISKNNVRFEIKCSGKSHSYWEGVGMYHNFLEHAKAGNVHYIVNMYIDKEADEVILRGIAEAKSFEDYIEDSNFSKSKYYHPYNAEKAGKCWIGESAIRKIKELTKEQ